MHLHQLKADSVCWTRIMHGDMKIGFTIWCENIKEKTSWKT
jgi:hypothetical protein